MDKLNWQAELQGKLSVILSVLNEQLRSTTAVLPTTTPLALCVGFTRSLPSSLQSL